MSCDFKLIVNTNYSNQKKQRPPLGGPLISTQPCVPNFVNCLRQEDCLVIVNGVQQVFERLLVRSIVACCCRLTHVTRAVAVGKEPYQFSR